MELLHTEGDMAKRTLNPFPDRKISETFLHFAEPLLQDLPCEAPEGRARDALQVAWKKGHPGVSLEEGEEGTS